MMTVRLVYCRALTEDGRRLGTTSSKVSSALSMFGLVMDCRAMFRRLGLHRLVVHVGDKGLWAFEVYHDTPVDAVDELCGLTWEGQPGLGPDPKCVK